MNSCEKKLDKIKEIIGDPTLYMEETKVFVLTMLSQKEQLEAMYNALWRLCEVNRKDFLKIIRIMEES